MNLTSSVSPEALAAIADPAGLEAILILKRNGQAIGGWTRKPAPQDVVSVMTATLLGSAETLLDALGKGSPPELILVADASRILLRKSGSGAVVLVAGPASVPDARLRDAAAKAGALVQRSAGPSPRA